MLDDSRGLPAPARAERALRQARQHEADVERALGAFFDARLWLAAAPDDTTARRPFEDSLFTLGVLMAEPGTYAAVREAVQYAEG
ncbi:hypothetical protein ADK61_27330 [Streptomyces sp. XY66]|nr:MULTISPECIES: DUF5133 domain-containing protein [unclassified Streptomyces]KOU62467.1 hypothetical protein ADK96_26755 [Streptomyces sp. IGB124]KOU72403.1 hypothetical protein ADK61_27330 [Streptomyces sp. XY66]